MKSIKLISEEIFLNENFIDKIKKMFNKKDFSKEDNKKITSTWKAKTDNKNSAPRIEVKIKNLKKAFSVFGLNDLINLFDNTAEKLNSDIVFDDIYFKDKDTIALDVAFDDEDLMTKSQFRPYVYAIGGVYSEFFDINELKKNGVEITSYNIGVNK